MKTALREIRGAVFVNRLNGSVRCQCQILSLRRAAPLQNDKGKGNLAAGWQGRRFYRYAVRLRSRMTEWGEILSVVTLPPE